MKATLQFTLPEENYEYEAAVKGTASLCVLDELLTEIRSALKYGSGRFKADADLDEAVQEKIYGTLEKVQDYIREAKEYYGIPECD